VSEPDLSKFRQKLAERQAREAAERKLALETAPQFDPEVVPDDPYERSDADRQMDEIIASIDIIDAYIRWIGKMRPVVKGSQTESIMISCPIPGHKDSKPSAWINSEKQVWHCGACEQGGDVHDFAAFHFGYPVPGYKEGATFHELRQKMAEDYGFVITRLPGGVTSITPPEEEADEPASPAVEVEEQPTAELIELYDEGDRELFLPSLDWRPIVPPDTFLDAYMKACVQDDVPEEYHLFHGLLAIGFALGRDVRLADLVPVYGNLFICTLGASGSGKSKAGYHLDKLLNTALPHDWTDPSSKGVRKVASPGSAEVLIHHFQKPITDPADPKKIIGYAPVRGLIDFNEFSSLIGRANRQGSVLTPTLMQFYDMQTTVATSSMTHGAKEATEPFASALTTTQPLSLRRLFNMFDEVSGFLNRWVFIPGTPKQRVAIGGVRVDIDPAVEPLQNILGWAASFRSDEFMEWSDPAAKLFTEFFHDQIEPDKANADNAMIVRIDLLMKKMILLFSGNMHQKLVHEQAVRDAIYCYDYLKESYAVPAGQIGNTLTSEVSEAVLFQARKAAQRGHALSLNDIAKLLKRRKYPNELLLKTVDSLVKLGFLTVQQPKAGSVGRPTTRYKYVD
jgi:hypothetical protein